MTIGFSSPSTMTLSSKFGVHTNNLDALLPQAPRDLKDVFHLVHGDTEANDVTIANFNMVVTFLGCGSDGPHQAQHPPRDALWRFDL